MATLERILVKRKCNLQDRPGDFALVRKNVKLSLVRPIDQNGQLGAEEQIDTALVTNERKYEAPKAPKEDKEYPADRPERKICLIEGRGNERYHLLRQGADFSKVLKVGEAGKGEWVINNQIADKFMVPSANRPRYIPRQPIRVCEISGREGKFLLLRQTTKGSRVIGPIVGENYGETVDNSMIVNEQKVVIRKSKKSGDTTETATIVMSNPPQADEPPNIPESDSELHGHHPAADEHAETVEESFTEPEEMAAEPDEPQQPRPQQQPPQQPRPQQQPPQQPRPQQQPGQPQRPQSQPGQPQPGQPQRPQQQGAPQQPQQVPQHPSQQPQQPRQDPRFQPGSRPQQVPQRPAPVR